MTEPTEFDLLELATPYALNAMPDTERAAIDRQLARDPIGNGQHVREGLYRIIVSPLVVYYSVEDSTRTVEVEGVGRVL